MVAISCTSCFVSRALVEDERSWLSFARTHGWIETWTLDGSEVAMTAMQQLGDVEKKLNVSKQRVQDVKNQQRNKETTLQLVVGGVEVSLHLQ